MWGWLGLLKQTWPQYIRQFAEMTTLHGVRYLGERNRSMLERLVFTENEKINKQQTLPKL